MTRFLLILSAAAATLSCTTVAPAAPGHDLNELIARLGADSYQTLEAAMHELAGLGDGALPALDAAARFGYDDFEWMDHDADLENVRKDARYAQFREELEGRRPEAEHGAGR